MNVNVLRNRRKPALAHNIDIPAQHLACRVCATRAPSPSPSRVRSDISALAQLVHRSLSVASPCCRADLNWMFVCCARSKNKGASVRCRHHVFTASYIKHSAYPIHAVHLRPAPHRHATMHVVFFNGEATLCRACRLCLFSRNNQDTHHD